VQRWGDSGDGIPRERDEANSPWNFCREAIMHDGVSRRRRSGSDVLAESRSACLGGGK